MRLMDLTGVRFQHWLVISRVDGTNPPKWNCECLNCHSTKSVFGQTIRENKNTPCHRCGTGSKKNYIPHKSYDIYRRRARKLNRPFEITLSEFKVLINQPCHYCGKTPESFYPSGKPSHGLDRKDNTRGYTLDNVVPCCSNCNSAKGSSSYESFLERRTKQ